VAKKRGKGQGSKRKATRAKSLGGPPSMPSVYSGFPNPPDPTFEPPAPSPPDLSKPQRTISAAVSNPPIPPIKPPSTFSTVGGNPPLPPIKLQAVARSRKKAKRK